MNIYLFYGNNKTIIDNKVNEIINKENIIDNNIIKYNLENNLDNIIEEASMFSMFGDKKLIIVNITFKEDIDVNKLEKYFENLNEKNYIVFICNEEKIDTRKKIVKLISKHGQVLELKSDSNYIRCYINNYIKDYKIDINYFMNKVNDNLENIKNELDKLMLYKIDDKIITNKDIDDLVESNIEEEIFALTDSVIKKDDNRTLSLYNKFIERNYEPIHIISLLANQFQFLYQVKKLYGMGKGQDDIAKTLEVHPYRVKLAIQNTYYYTENDLLNSIYRLANLDRDIKLSKIDKFIGLELFLINREI